MKTRRTIPANQTYPTETVGLLQARRRVSKVEITCPLEAGDE
jgi:hypothetical protein